MLAFILQHIDTIVAVAGHELDILTIVQRIDAIPGVHVQ